VFDTRLVIDTLVPPPVSPYPKIAFLAVGGATIVQPPPFNVIPPVIVIDIF
jgi:hypothetical protein